MGIAAFTGNNAKKISIANLATIPSFLRFDEIKLFYDIGSRPIAEKCLLFGAILLAIKSALNDSNAFTVHAQVKRNMGDDFDYDYEPFSNHMELTNHLRDEILPICGSSHRYKFSIRFQAWDSNADTNAIASILRIPQIVRCSNVSFSPHYSHYNYTKLPINAIIQWLNQADDRIGSVVDQKKQQKFFKISCPRISNALEMCTNLIMVILFQSLIGVKCGQNCHFDI